MKIIFEVGDVFEEKEKRNNIASLIMESKPNFKYQVEITKVDLKEGWITYTSYILSPSEKMTNISKGKIEHISNFVAALLEGEIELC